jgi:hypothetical protein
MGPEELAASVNVLWPPGRSDVDMLRGELATWLMQHPGHHSHVAQAGVWGGGSVLSGGGGGCQPRGLRHVPGSRQAAARNLPRSCHKHATATSPAGAGSTCHGQASGTWPGDPLPPLPHAGSHLRAHWREQRPQAAAEGGAPPRLVEVLEGQEGVFDRRQPPDQKGVVQPHVCLQVRAGCRWLVLLPLFVPLPLLALLGSAAAARSCCSPPPPRVRQVAAHFN